MLGLGGLQGQTLPYCLIASDGGKKFYNIGPILNDEKQFSFVSNEDWG